MTPALLALVVGVGCGPKVVGPSFTIDQGGPVWPPPPAPAQVSWVGEVRLLGDGFGRPIDVACTDDHLLAVADPDASTVWLLDLSRGGGGRRTTAGGAPLEAPVGVDLHGQGRLVVVDAARRGVFVGRTGRRGRLREWVAEGHLERPTTVLATGSLDALVVDRGGHAIYRLQGRAGELSPLASGRGDAGLGFNYPVDVAFSEDGSLVVADALNAVVQRLDGAGLHLVAGGHGYEGQRLVRPKVVAVDAWDRIHVVDAGMQHVQVYASTGELLGRYGQPGDGPGTLALPAGICIDVHAHVFVADSLHHRLAVYQIEAPGSAVGTAVGEVTP